MSEKYESALRRSDLFASLDQAGLACLAGSVEETSRAAGEHLVRQGDVADGLFVIVEGELEVSLEGGEGVALRRLGPGSVVGEIALLLGGTRSASVRAATPCVALFLARSRFERLVEEQPQVMAPLSRDLAERARRGKVAGFLQDLFGALTPEALSEIERRVTWVHLESGKEIFRQGDQADGAYLVVVGRLRVVVRSAAGVERVIDETGPGQWVGEMALLTGKERSATVYALRDTELLWLPEAVFDSLIVNHSRAMRETMRVLVNRMQRQMRGDDTSRAGAKTFALLPATPAVQLEALAAQLAAALGRYGSVLHLTASKLDQHLGKPGLARAPASDPAQLRVGPWLIEQEEGHDFVIYEADSGWTGWTERAVRHADTILLAADARDAAQVSPIERSLASCFEGRRAPKQSLVLLQPPGPGHFAGTRRWLDGRRVDAHYHVRRGSTGDVARLARLLTGKAIGLVLGGGGSRGYAHLGVLRALDELGIPVDAVGGTSIGAIVATGHAYGMGWSEMLTRLPPILTRGFLGVTLPMVSLLSASTIMSSLYEMLGELEVEDMGTPLFCVSTNLTRGGEMIHRRGSASLAIRASTSIPGIFPPVSFGGDLLVDGGLANNVPVDTMASLYPGAVIAVDVMPETDLQASGALPLALSGWAAARRRLNPFAEAAAMPDILSILVRSVTAASHSMMRAERSAALASLFLRPSVTKWNVVDFSAAKPVAEEGYRGTEPAIAAWWKRERASLLGQS